MLINLEVVVSQEAITFVVISNSYLSHVLSMGTVLIPCRDFNSNCYRKTSGKILISQLLDTITCMVFEGNLCILLRSGQEQGILVLNNAIASCTEAIEQHKGKLVVKEAARAVSVNFLYISFLFINYIFYPCTQFLSICLWILFSIV